MTFRFPEVHPEAQCSIEFQRTLRIPDDDRDYPLPPGLGRFPLHHLDDFADRLPQEALHRGGVVMPMHQAEAIAVATLLDTSPTISHHIRCALSSTPMWS